MSFLLPWALALAGLAIVPLVLHLVRRDTDRRISFPSLRYLQSAQRQSARSMRIRDWLLVAARISVVVLLAAAASRPLIGTGDSGSHVPTDLMLLLDNTASMERLAGGTSLLETAKALAGTSLSRAGVEDRVWLITPVDGVVLAGGSAADAIRLLPTIRGSDAAGLLPESVALTAPAIPAREGRAREVQLLSDLQAGSFQGSAELGDDWAIRIFHLRPDHEWNGSVSSLEIAPSLPVPPGASFTVSAMITAHAETESTTADSDRAGPDVRLLLDGSTVGIRNAEWGSNVVFAVPAPAPGPHVVRVEINPAGLRADDGRQMGVRVASPARVELSASGGSDAEFLRKALETLADADRVQLVAAEHAEVLIQVAAGEGPAPITETAYPARILIPPSDMLSLSAFNERLTGLGVPWAAEPDPAAGSLRIEAGGPNALRGEIVSRRYRLVSAPAPASPLDSVLLRTSDGEPWLVRGRTSGSEIYLLLASPLHPEATGIPTSARMIQFTDALVNRWSRPGDPSGETLAGEEFVLPPRADSIAGPEAPPARVEGGSPWSPRTAGTWRIAVRTDDGRDSRYVGVNVPDAESDPTTLDSAGLTLALGSDGEVVEAQAEWDRVIFARRRGHDIGILLLAGALAALALEAWLAAPRAAARRRDSSSGGEANVAGSGA